MSNSVVPDPYRSYNTVYSLVNCIPVNPLYYKTVMGDVTMVRRTNASWGDIPISTPYQRGSHNSRIAARTGRRRVSLAAVSDENIV